MSQLQQCEKPVEINHLITQALQPDILGQIFLYTGTIRPISKLLFANINKEKLLKEWFQRIHIKTKFSDVEPRQISFLWVLYQRRVDDAPNKNLQELAGIYGMEGSIFYSKTFYMDNYIFHYRYDYPSDEEYYSSLNSNPKVLQFIKNNNMREGDLIDFEEEQYETHHLFYNGKELEPPVQHSNSLLYPRDIHINNYPVVDYFKYSAEFFDIYSDELPNELIYFNTLDTKLELISDDKTNNIVPKALYQYRTLGKSKNYKIYTFDREFIKRWNGIIILSSHPDFEIFPNLRELHCTIRSLRVLYDTNLRNSD